MFGRSRLWQFSPDDGGAGGSGGDGKKTGDDDKKTGKDDKKTPETIVFEDWLKEQADPIKEMLEGHTKGLKSALDSERDGRKALEKQVRDLAAKAEKDSEAQKQLTGLADQIGEADRKADFYDAAHQAGVTNLKLAYMIAVQDEMFDRRGSVDFERMKKNYPELFGTTKPPAGNAGSGTNTEQPTHQSMNEFIRRAAGRQ